MTQTNMDVKYNHTSVWHAFECVASIAFNNREAKSLSAIEPLTFLPGFSLLLYGALLCGSHEGP
jgi:hypothetical protein